MAVSRRSRQTWGPWNFEATAFVLSYEKGRHSYEVDLDECQDSAQVLDWIMQARKAWATPDDLGHLVEALGDILQPQSNMCSGGKNRKTNPRDVAASHGYKAQG
jgi:hypothetical protein